MERFRENMHQDGCQARLRSTVRFLGQDACSQRFSMSRFVSRGTSMKIIERGREQKGWAKECVCTGDGNGGGGCGAKLLVEQVDLYRTSSSCRDETDYFNTFSCAQCGVETDLKNLTSNIAYSLPSKTKWLADKKEREEMQRSQILARD